MRSRTGTASLPSLAFFQTLETFSADFPVIGETACDRLGKLITLRPGAGLEGTECTGENP